MKRFILPILFVLMMLSPANATRYANDLVLTGATGIWSDTRSYVSLTAAVAGMAGSERDLYIAKNENITTLTIPSTTKLHFFGDGAITISGTLTLNTTSIEAGDRQIFYGAGAVDFTDGSVARTTWFSNIGEAITETANDEVTLVVAKAGWVLANVSVGNRVTLKFDAPGNEITVAPGIVVGTVRNVVADDYPCFKGAGRVDFADGAKVRSGWFNRFEYGIRHIDNSVVELTVSESDTVYANTVVHANTTCVFQPRAILSAATAITITINGPIVAGLNQHIFSLSGGAVAVFGTEYAPPKLSPMWWGAVGDDSTNNSTPLQATIDCAEAAGGRSIYIPEGIFSYDTQLSINAIGISIIGAGNRVSTLKYTGSSIGINVDIAESSHSALYFGDFRLLGSSSALGGIRFTEIDSTVKMHRLWFDTFTKDDAYGVWFRGGGGAVTSSGFANTIQDCYFDDCYMGLHANEGWSGGNILNNVFGLFRKYAIKLDDNPGTKITSSVVIQGNMIQNQRDTALTECWGIYANKCRSLYIAGNRFEQNSTAVTTLFTCIEFLGITRECLTTGNYYSSSNGKSVVVGAAAVYNRFIGNFYSTTPVPEDNASSTQWIAELWTGNVNKNFFRGQNIFHGVEVGDIPLTAKRNVASTGNIFQALQSDDSVLASVTKEGGFITHGVNALADEATPSVLGLNIFKTSGTANDPITDFDDGVEGQIITIMAEHSVVITDGTHIFLDGAANWTMADTESLTLVCKADNKWYERGRSDRTP